ncbi:hypothetical protein GOZ97_07540 [Agrobacterium vitis]|uniref:hypothetical protein n=1 Tax=Agrobacterium vitis TaxID=373 RepID=UPI0008FBB99F|nr:hypothetical protein [Agrobacterium vitis]MUZ53052.1 hypothetical protein [Agrobacterium vitis]MUZ91271.1 hypothetical protein [Agrobacterium vitis]MVA40285.1 hypothetical protein [Agrobacterium vitis]NSX96131.1 hypothetical protein [Agrobacterium vitis]NSZ27270.1 hypothetical protein [Agrobacterium vitis]
MTSIALFSDKTPATMSPQTFADLSEADKTLFARLMRERAVFKTDVEEATGLPFAEIHALCEKDHRPLVLNEGDTTGWGRGQDEGDLSGPALKLLTLMQQAGGPVAMPQAEMERQAGLAARSSRWILESLKGRGLIVCLRRGKGSRQATWSITDAGREALAASLAEAADA